MLLLAGDVSDCLTLLITAFKILRNRFKEIIYLPGNHELWLWRDRENDSLAKFHLIEKITADYGITMKPVQLKTLSIVPLFGWYDYSFGRPSQFLKQIWVDYTACKWPSGYDEYHITRYFTSLNYNIRLSPSRDVISFSHFVPRIDLMPYYIEGHIRLLYPVLGSSILEKQIRKLGSKIHVYGHSHINCSMLKDNTLYINNAFGYPNETAIANKTLRCILEV